MRDDSLVTIVDQHQPTALPRHVQAYGTKVGEDGEATSYLSNLVAEPNEKARQVGKKNRSFTPISSKS